MPWIIGVDWHISMFRRIDDLEDMNFIAYSQSILLKLFKKIVSLVPHESISLVLLENGIFSCSEFTNSIEKLNKLIDYHSNDSHSIVCLTTDFAQTVLHCVRREAGKFSDSQHLKVLLFSDKFDEWLNYNSKRNASDYMVSKNSTCIVVNVCGSKEVSSRLNVLRDCFSEFHVIANPSNSDFDSLFDLLVPFLRCEFNGSGIISCGHLSSPFKLESSLCLRNWKKIIEPVDSESRLSVEIFGFLQVSDVKNPPVVCQHTMLYEPDENLACQKRSVDFLRVLLASLGTTETVAMANVYLEPKTDASDVGVESSKDRQFLVHGYISKHGEDTLLLSLFPEENGATTWLGTFEYLASASDFDGRQIYGPNLTPFPVNVGEQPSYKSVSKNTSDFRYTSWVNSTLTPSSEVNKILRLARRLPDKKDVFLRDVMRLLSTAQVQHWTELADTVKRLVLEQLPMSLDQQTKREVFIALKMKL